MISVCIPVYNFDIEPLITALVPQVNNAGGEIIVIDDHSTEKKEENRKAINKHKEIRYIELSKNIGRAAIRNLFLQYARYDYLLFLDCDSYIISPSFIENYIKEIKSSAPAIIVGGRIYGPKPRERKKLLRWKYGVQRESKPASIRRKTPNASFMTNNFVIAKHLLESIRFNEDLYLYGHEDTLFGYDLKKHGVEIIHIENPVLNGDIEDAATYINKTRQSIKNLAFIVKKYDNEKALAEDITLLKTYTTMKRYMLHIPVIITAPVTLFVLPAIIRLTASVTLLNIYKLILFAWEKK